MKNIFEQIINNEINITDIPMEALKEEALWNNIVDLFFLNSNKKDITKEEATYLLNAYEGDDNKIISQMIIQGEVNYNCLPERYRSNMNWVAVAGANHLSEIYHIKELMNDKFWIKELISKDADLFLHISSQLQKDKSFILSCLLANGFLLKHLDFSLSKDTPLLNEDKDIVFTALRLSSFNPSLSKWEYVGKKLKADREYILSLLTQTPKLFQYLDPIFQDDEEMTRMVISQYGYLLKYASERLRNNLDIALLSCKKEYGALDFISDELKNNIVFVKELVTKFPSAIFKCGEDIKQSKKIASIVCCHQGYQEVPLISFFNDDIRNDQDIALTSLITDYLSFKYFNEDNQHNQTLLLQYFKHPNFNEDLLDILPDSLLNHEQFMLSLFEQSDGKKKTNVLRKMGKELKQSEHVQFPLLSGNYDYPDLKNTDLHELDLLIFQHVNFQCGDELLLLKFIRHSYFQQFYDSKNYISLNRALHRAISDPDFKSLIKFNKDSSEFYDYLLSIELSQQLEKELPLQTVVEKPKI